jgi:hypothetical protein
MGSTISLAAGRSAEIEVVVENGAGWALRLVADGAPAFETEITTQKATVRVSLAPARYVRAELVGDAPAELVPAYAPPGLDLREWRWALSNPLYFQ